MRYNNLDFGLWSLVLVHLVARGMTPRSTQVPVSRSLGPPGHSHHEYRTVILIGAPEVSGEISEHVAGP